MDYMLENGADPNKGTIKPLYAACENNIVNIDTLTYLIDHGEDVNGLSQPFKNISVTALYAIFQKRKPDLNAYRFLMSKGAELNKGDLSPLYALCKNNPNLNLIKSMIKSGADIDYGVITPLYIANKQKNAGDDKLINFLLKFNPDINKGSVTPLFGALKNKNCTKSDIEKLIELGADLNKAYEIENRNLTPLSMAMKRDNDNKEIIDVLLDNGADPNIGEKPPLYEAIEGGKNEIVSILLKYGADPNIKYHKYTPLSFVYHKYKNDSIIYSLIEYGAIPSEKYFNWVRDIIIQSNREDLINKINKIASQIYNGTDIATTQSL